MGKAKVAINIDEHLLAEVDLLVRQGVFPSRSKVIEDALHDHIAELRRSRLARECAKLDVRDEQALADEFHVGNGEF